MSATITTPTGPNPPQWLALTKVNGRWDVRANAFPEAIRSAGMELLRIASEMEEKKDDEP